MANQMTPAELRAAADRIAFPAYPVTPEGRTQWDEDRYASVSAMKSLAGILERDEEVGDDEGWHIGGAWGDYGEVVVPLRILSYVIGGQLDEQVVSTDPGYALTYAEQVRRAEQAEDRLADVLDLADDVTEHCRGHVDTHSESCWKWHAACLARVLRDMEEQ